MDTNGRESQAAFPESGRALRAAAEPAGIAFRRSAGL